MRWGVGERRSNPYTCCCCCHVRLGTVLIGVFSLLIDLLVIAYTLVLIFHPELYEQSKYHSNDVLLFTPDTDRVMTSPGVNLTAESFRNSTHYFWNGRWNCDDGLISMTLTVLSALLAVGLLYGAIRGYPKYLLPFFCMQVFEFCVSTLSIIGYFTYEASVKDWLHNETWLPMRDELLGLDNGWLMLIAGILAVIVLWIQAYFISVVWSCYKFLCESQYRASGRTRHVASFELELVHLDRVLTSSSSESHPLPQPNHTALSTEMMVLPPKYEDLLQRPDGPESAIVMVSPPPYSTVITPAAAATAADADKSDEER